MNSKKLSDMGCDKLIDTDRLPGSSDHHNWADYIELLCLVNVDAEISQADIADRIRERKDLGESPLDDDAEISKSERDDKAMLHATDWFRHLQYRSHAFQDYYPFTLTDSNTLRKFDTFSEEQNIYTLLLLLSNLSRISSKQQRTSLTSLFELISLEALRRYLPAASEAYLFGKSMYNKGPYTGKLWDKVNRLATDIRERVVCDEEQFSSRDTGDGGLDLVGWLFPDTTAPGALLVFGQCACTEEWKTKQYSSSVDAWKPIMQFTAPPVNCVFIPFCYRNPSGRWHRQVDIKSMVLMDRLRILKLMSHPNDDLCKLVKQSIQDYLEFREPFS